MKDAVSEILFSLLSLVIFVGSLLTLFHGVSTNKELVKTFSKTNYVRDELQLHEGKSEYSDYWDNGQWESPKIKVSTNSIISEIYLQESLKFYINGNEIPADVIKDYRQTGNAATIITYLHNSDYTKEYEYGDNGILIAIHYSC